MSYYHFKMICNLLFAGSLHACARVRVRDGHTFKQDLVGFLGSMVQSSKTLEHFTWYTLVLQQMAQVLSLTFQENINHHAQKNPQCYVTPYVAVKTGCVFLKIAKIW